jgi:hypothetical protein
MDFFLVLSYDTRPPLRFNSLMAAIYYGETNFPQNDWQIKTPQQGVVYQHNSSLMIEAMANEERSRFDNANFWATSRRAERLREAEVRLRIQEQEALRVTRLQGFEFHGLEPEILERTRNRHSTTLRMEDFFESITPTKEHQPNFRINWKKEGF